jgi:hypothetical protein
MHKITVQHWQTNDRESDAPTVVVSTSIETKVLDYTGATCAKPNSENPNCEHHLPKVVLIAEPQKQKNSEIVLVDTVIRPVRYRITYPITFTATVYVALVFYHFCCVLTFSIARNFIFR